MPVSLIKVLAAHGMYLAIGLPYLFGLRNAQKRSEQFLYGFGLVFLASFALAGTALVDDAASKLAETLNAASPEANSLMQFRGYMHFIYWILTFLFGGVGVNAISASLSATTDQNLAQRIAQIEAKLGVMAGDIQTLRFNVNYLWATVAVVALGLVVLFLVR